MIMGVFAVIVCVSAVIVCVSAVIVPVSAVIVPVSAVIVPVSAVSATFFVNIIIVLVMMTGMVTAVVRLPFWLRSVVMVVVPVVVVVPLMFSADVGLMTVVKSQWVAEGGLRVEE
jgi:hypothetical protein